jgi:uncharacterized delta-60 repeat protein
MKVVSRLISATGVVLLLALGACGGGDSSSPPAAVIGAAGGTVSSPNGAQVLVPPGALAQATLIEVTPSSVGAPGLPAGVTAYGPIYAFTPHGTTFLTPVTITVPFDPALVPAGTIPVLYKTNATQTAFEVVPGSTVSGNFITAQVTGFSYAAPGSPQSKPTVLAFTDDYSFWDLHLDGSETGPYPDPTPVSTNTDIHIPNKLGVIDLRPLLVEAASYAEVHVSSQGSIYWVAAVAPYPDFANPKSDDGHTALLHQTQYFKKINSAASMQLIISQVTVELMDSHGMKPNLIECPEQNYPGLDYTDCKPLYGYLNFKVNAWAKKNNMSLAHGDLNANVQGFLGRWDHFVGDFDFSSTLRYSSAPVFSYNSDVDAYLGNHAKLSLQSPIVIEIPLDTVGDQEEFYVQITAQASAYNRRGGDAFAGAWFHDPQKMEGVTFTSKGIEPIAVPGVKLVPPTPIQIPAPACPTGTDPAAGTLQFTSPNFQSAERIGSTGGAIVTVSRTGGSKGEVSALFTTRDGTGKAGIDYNDATMLVRFADGEQGSRFAKIPVINNQIEDGSRTVLMTLSNPMGCGALGAQNTAMFTIIDDDKPPPVLPTYHVGGTITGLMGTGLVLKEISTGATVTPTNGSFTLAPTFFTSSPYNVQVISQPVNPNQNCVVTNGVGSMGTADVSNIAVTCTTILPNGALDPSFGNAGMASSGVLGAPTAMALQGDGKVVMVGGLKLARFNNDGTLDSGFGTAGQVTVPFNGGLFDVAQGLALQADGKIIVVGSMTVGGQSDFALARFNTNGTLDTTFGTNGIVTTDFAGNADLARRVAIQSDGKLVVAGNATSGSGATSNIDFGVARYNSDGSLDSTFGTGGKVQTNIAGNTDLAQGLALQSDGKIVLAGRVAASGGVDPDFGIVRYNANGTLDTTFGAGLTGIIRTDFGKGNWEEASDVAVQADGKILVSGRVRVGTVFNFALARFGADGLADLTFGNAGLVVTAFSPPSNVPNAPSDVANGLVIQADGKIVVAGQSANAGANPDFAVARYLSTGALDTGFGTAGKATVDFFGSIDGATGVVVQSDGKIVLGGFARNAGSTGLALARLLP